MSREIVAYVYRTAEGQEEEEEIEVIIDGELEGADPSVGDPGGFAYYGAKRSDNGEAIKLTAAEIERISVDEMEAECDRSEAYDEDAYDRVNDR